MSHSGFFVRSCHQWAVIVIADLLPCDTIAAAIVSAIRLISVPSYYFCDCWLTDFVPGFVFSRTG